MYIAFFLYIKCSLQQFLRVNKAAQADLLKIMHHPVTYLCNK